MPQDITTTVYTFKELEALGDEKATDKALEWLGEAATSWDWWDGVYDDAKTIGAEIEAFDIYRNSLSLRLVKDAVSVALAIKQHHGETCDTYKLACDFLSVDDEYNGVNGKISLAEPEELQDLYDAYSEKVLDFEKALGEEYLAMLKREWEYINSKEYLADCAEANEYTFTDQGKRFG